MKDERILKPNQFSTQKNCKYERDVPSLLMICVEFIKQITSNRFCTLEGALRLTHLIFICANCVSVYHVAFYTQLLCAQSNTHKSLCAISFP